MRGIDSSQQRVVTEAAQDCRRRASVLNGVCVGASALRWHPRPTTAAVFGARVSGVASELPLCVSAAGGRLQEAGSHKLHHTFAIWDLAPSNSAGLLIYNAGALAHLTYCGILYSMLIYNYTVAVRTYGED